jgi:predicted dithiol-disulfide oxidoreductase (DUF899 family)
MKGKIKMSTSMIEKPKIVSRDEWLAARKKLLAKEKQLTCERHALAAERRQLPWVQVEKNYVFDSTGGTLDHRMRLALTLWAGVSCHMYGQGFM